MKVVRRKRRWFLEALNGQTDKAFASRLDEDKSKLEFRVSGRAEPIKAWEVSEREKKYFQSSRSSYELKFVIWTALLGEMPVEWSVETVRQARIRDVRRLIKEGKGRKVLV